MKTVLLVGGLGTRLRAAVPSLPKALASVGNRPFLELLIRQLARQGFYKLVMCTGYRAEQIEETFGDGGNFGVAIEYSRETTPMGTAGALKLAHSYLQHEREFLVLNGDSFLEIDLNEFIGFHRRHNGVVTLAAVPVQNASRYGTVQVEAGSRVVGFIEKTGQEAPGTINAGVYVFGSAVFRHIPDGPASLEGNVFPRLLEEGVYAVEQQGMFIDIGTPDDYLRANDMAGALAVAALSERHETSHSAIAWS
jgi:D-glycero-alpha-D-manno-heptose 1-phosphate guanylyltransferase